MPLRISVIIVVTMTERSVLQTSLKGVNNQIPPDLEKVLWDISAKIPVCILSTKDFGFLRKKVQFAKIVSCIMGLEIFELATPLASAELPMLTLTYYLITNTI